ncbi:MAG TPA: RDD family protein [Pseudoxanthomonas sp.]|nr:RDD family protein [Pseudoxanthomonas sp.]
MESWYYVDAHRQQQGPLASEALMQRFHRGELQLDTLVWREGLSQWQRLREFSHELGLHEAPRNVPLDADDTLAAPAPLASDSPYAPPRAALSSDEAFYASGQVVHAGFWKRTAAYLIDAMVVGIAAQIVQMVLAAVFFGMNLSSFASSPETLFSSTSGLVFLAMIYLFPLMLFGVYYATFHASSKQATLGKMAIGIKVVRGDGRRITLGRGIGRFFAFILSALILYIGYLMAAFTERKQGLHDMVCDTLVVDKWAYTAHPEWQNPKLGTVTVVVLSIFAVLILGLIALLAVIIGLTVSNA